MKICRFDADRVGIVDGEQVLDVTGRVAAQLPPRAWPQPRGDQFIEALASPALRDTLAAAAGAGDCPRLALGDVRLLSPVANPGKLIAVPVNYQAHVDESNADVGINFGSKVSTVEKYGLFLKATSALVGPDAGVEIHSDPEQRRTDHEIELALVIGRRARHIAAAAAYDYVAGYTIGLDITVRGTEDRSYRKSLDTFCVLGPWLVTADEFGVPDDVGLTLRVDGEPRQRANTRDLIWDVPRIIEFASAAYTLDPGDVILTGTPEGVAPIVPGNVMDCAADRIGAMRVAVRAAAARQ